MNLRDQLAIQHMYNQQIRQDKTSAELKDEHIAVLQKQVKKQSHVIKNTKAATIGSGAV